MSLFTVALDTTGSIIKISNDCKTIGLYIKRSKRNDLIMMTFCSFDEYYEWLVESGYLMAI